MAQAEEVINPPFRYIHAVMYLVTIGFGAVPIWLFGLGIATGSLGEPGVAWGIVIAIIFHVAWFVGSWLTYLVHQPAAYVSDDAIVFRSWVQLGSWAGSEQTIPLAQVQEVLLWRPIYVQFTIPGASTRVATLVQEKGGVARARTFWWRRSDYLALQAILEKRGIPTQYERAITAGPLLSSF